MAAARNARDRWTTLCTMVYCSRLAALLILASLGMCMGMICTASMFAHSCLRAT